MTHGDEPHYIIPERYRRMENGHIVFWLLKDIGWCLVWQPLGLAMTIPTLTISIIIVWRTRKIPSELAHNMAITFWITANATWMISEFFHFDTAVIWRSVTGKHLALIPFITGLGFLLNYYLFQKRREDKGPMAVTM